MENRWRAPVLFLILCVFVCAGCVKKDNGSSRPARESGSETETTTKAERYNTQDTVIITGIDTEKSQVSVRGIGSYGKVYVLNYNGATSIKNKYGSEILISGLQVGDVAEVYYMSGTQRLAAIQESAEAWENDSVTKWNIDYENKIMTIGDENYKYDGNTFISSGRKTIDIRSISGVDTLVVHGADKQIYSIVVKTGHGYIKLADTINMVGGIVDVDGKIATVIKEDMILVAPEGEHTLTASKDGKGGSTKVTVHRDSEITVSLSAFQGEVEKNGALKLNVQPAGVRYNVFIDGNEADAKSAIDLPYGVHRLLITSDKYEDYTEDITISSIYMNKTVDLSRKGDGETTASGENTTTKDGETTSSGEKETQTGKADNKMIISKPEGASLYLDGVFKGTLPLTLTKEPGSHTVILRKTGCKSVAYSIELSDDTNNVYLSFPDMEENE